MRGPMDVLIPTFNRPQALAITLAGLASQPGPLRVLVADQSDRPVQEHQEIETMVRVLELNGHTVEVFTRDVRLGVAEQRDFLLRHSNSDSVLCLDDDIWLQPWATEVMQTQLSALDAGLVGMAPMGLSYRTDRRPDQWSHFEPILRIAPEEIRPDSHAWQRHQLHNAANPLHLGEQIGASPDNPVAYRIAWIGGCVMYLRDSLEQVGGFSFWSDLPHVHAGEDVLAQLRVMQRFGGAGVLPSGAVHLEFPTTVTDRQCQAYEWFDEAGDRRLYREGPAD